MELSLDTASEVASIALSQEGVLEAEATWRCRRNHTVELLAAVDRLLTQTSTTKADLTAVFVSTGPGMYTGLRVGIAIAKGLAHGLALPLIGVGRLELDAYPHAAFPGRVIAVHRAGRGELAWAAYRGSPWREETPPRLSKPEELAAQVAPPLLVVGEVDAALAEQLAAKGAALPPASASIRRAATLAELGHQRLLRGEPSHPALLQPVYLRPPAIGPQPSGR